MATVCPRAMARICYVDSNPAQSTSISNLIRLKTTPWGYLKNETQEWVLDIHIAVLTSEEKRVNILAEALGRTYPVRSFLLRKCVTLASFAPNSV